MATLHRLPVDPLHTLFIEECGKSDGVPILFLHGGPGTGIGASSSDYFDLSYYRVILFDQRGAGKSTPFASIENNTTDHLVEDIEKIRKHLAIEKWILFGGSWGSTLALCYALKHRQHVSGMILRGIFLAEESDLRWLLYEGAPSIWPKEYREFLSLIPQEKQNAILEAYTELVFHSDSSLATEASRAWMLWEARNLTLEGKTGAFDDFFVPERSLALARLELHYFQNSCFLPKGEILKKAHLLEGIPGKIIHGRYDTICPYSNAWKLHRAWPGSELFSVPLGGHSGRDPSIYRALCKATEDCKSSFFSIS